MVVSIYRRNCQQGPYHPVSTWCMSAIMVIKVMMMNTHQRAGTGGRKRCALLPTAGTCCLGVPLARAWAEGASAFSPRWTLYQPAPQSPPLCQLPAPPGSTWDGGARLQGVHKGEVRGDEGGCPKARGGICASSSPGRRGAGAGCWPGCPWALALPSGPALPSCPAL